MHFFGYLPWAEEASNRLASRSCAIAINAAPTWSLREQKYVHGSWSNFGTAESKDKPTGIRPTMLVAGGRWARRMASYKAMCYTVLRRKNLATGYVLRKTLAQTGLASLWSPDGQRFAFLRPPTLMTIWSQGWATWVSHGIASMIISSAMFNSQSTGQAVLLFSSNDWGPIGTLFELADDV